MKHLPTFQNEYLMYLKSLPAHCFSCEELNEEEANTMNKVPCKHADHHTGLPGKSVIANILNYARALEVFKKSDGESLLLIIN